MNPTIKTFPATKFIGKKLAFSYSDYRIGALWSSFMPRKHEIQNQLSQNLFNIQVNPIGFSFQPDEIFVKWAAVSVSNFDFVPNEMEILEIPEGLYAVFLHKGDASKARETFGYIFGIWLPNSEFELDQRPHFEILGGKYKNNDPNSEEEIWIPIKSKN